MIPAGIQRGDIFGFHDPHSWLAQAIEAVEGRHWTHIGWAISDTHILQMLGRGCTKTKMTDLSWKSGELKVVRVKPDLIRVGGVEAGVCWAERQKGRGYDYLLLAELLFGYLTHSRGWLPLTGLRRKYICSELVARPLWNLAGFRFQQSVLPENTTPADIMDSDKVFTVWK